MELLIEPWASWEEPLGTYGYKCVVLKTLAHSPIHYGSRALSHGVIINPLQVMDAEVNRVISGTVASVGGCNMTVLISGGITPS